MRPFLDSSKGSVDLEHARLSGGDITKLTRHSKDPRLDTSVCLSLPSCQAFLLSALLPFSIFSLKPSKKKKNSIQLYSRLFEV